ncbi:MAG: hypothetical protein JXX28_06130 [Deltaproteobacteria bacterium]|nr:hypothetical protein [Deltaproteobacteria bacterium]
MILLLALACVSEDVAGTGALDLSISGGEALRSGFPYVEGGAELAFVDGWEVHFDRYLISISEVALTDPADGAWAGGWEGARVVDLARAVGAEEPIATLEDLPALRLDLGFTLSPVSASSEGDSPLPADLAMMETEGWTHWIGGTATRGEERVDFSLGLSLPTAYTRCVNGKDFTEGIAVASHTTTGATLYAHAVHLFWDTLAAGDEDLRFDPWAAVAGEDGVVTADDLADQDLTDLRDADGDPLLDPSGARISYDDGGLLGPGQYDLLSFVRYGLRQSAHLNGVGYCRAAALE